MKDIPVFDTACDLVDSKGYQASAYASVTASKKWVDAEIESVRERLKALTARHEQLIDETDALSEMKQMLEALLTP